MDSPEFRFAAGSLDLESLLALSLLKYYLLNYLDFIARGSYKIA
jgi:hypothetical protein